MTTRRLTHSLVLVLAIGATAGCGTSPLEQGNQGGSGSTGASGGKPGASGTDATPGGKPSSGGTGGGPSGATGGGAPIAGSPPAGAMGGVGGGSAGTGGSNALSGMGGVGTGGKPTGGDAGKAEGGAGQPQGGRGGSAGAGPGGDAGAPAAGSGAGGSAGGGPCERGQVQAKEVLWIGDSWIEIPGSQHTTVRDLARAAGALGATEDYVDKAVSGSPIATIIKQYTDYQGGTTKVKVLLMDGGGIDVMQQGKTTASVNDVVDKVKAHFAQVKADGTVQHIIYYTYPQLPASGPGQDVGPMLQPGLQAACDASAVPCHYLYLEPLFTGHPEYIGSDSLHPSDAGAKVIGNAIWKIMQDDCIAQ